MKRLAIARMSVATVSRDRELMMVAIEVNIVPILRIWRKNKRPNPDIIKLKKWRNFCKCGPLKLFVLKHVKKERTLVCRSYSSSYSCIMFSSTMCCGIYCFLINHHLFCVPMLHKLRHHLKYYLTQCKLGFFYFDPLKISIGISRDPWTF